MTYALKKPLDTIIFDCDGTLSQIEGIDYLAKINGVKESVALLTEQAMAKTGISTSLYEARLNLVKPTYSQITTLSEIYFKNVSLDAKKVIRILKKLDKEIYIFSAGVNPAVKLFGEKLSVPEKNIFAVNLQFNSHGEYIDFDRQSPLTQKFGKKKLIQTLRQRTIGYIGDGMNDVEVLHDVERFVGYGGAFYRENIQKMVPFYSTEKSFMALLPFLLTQDELPILQNIQYV